MEHHTCATDGYGKYNTIFGIKWKIWVKDEQCYISNKCTVQDAYVISNGKNKQTQKEGKEDDDEEKNGVKKKQMIEREKDRIPKRI